ncbi:MAG: SRPBCC family protein, partial [Bacteroidetes bacterium]|nr:SRPBCC family protein [Bacteroidota bacterium]
MAKEIFIEKSVQINCNSSSVFDFVKYAVNMEKYSVWNMADPDKKTEYTGIDGTVGFIYRWDSKVKNVGAGEQEIVKIDTGKSIEFALRFERPMKNTGSSKITVRTEGENTSRVIWEFRG